MNFPRSRAPWIVVAVASDGTDRRADIFRVVVVLVVPEQVTGYANFRRRVPGGFVSDVRSPEKSREFLDADAVVINCVLGPRRGFHDDGRRIARLGRMVGRLIEQLQMPVVEIDTAAIRRLARSRVGEDK